MKLYTAQVCPFAHRVRLVLAWKGLSCERIEIDLANMPDWYRQLSPNQKVPLLLDGDDYYWESALINEYLEEGYPQLSLYPEGARARFRSRLLINWAEQKLIPPFYGLLRNSDPQAAEKLQKALTIAKRHGYGFHLFDAFRPSEAQWLLWERVPDPRYVGDPRKGSPHGRGVAIDLTLYDLKSGQDLEMGTPFDDFTELSHHGATGLTPEAERNRFMLLAIMSTAGWDFYFNEWWHYQLFNSKDYPLLSDKDAPKSIMGSLLTQVA